MKFPLWLCRSFLVIAGLASCGPPLTDPSSRDVSGHWTARDAIGALTDFDMTIIQRPDGTVSGTWSAKFPEDALCPPGLGSNPTGDVNGTNTVLEVHLAFEGAGNFYGQAIDDRTMKGSFVSCEVHPVLFSLAGRAPAR